MKRISEKLKSRGGASLIIALVLALVAVFVGGSVLAAATVNGGRLAQRRELQQAYLSQRSAAVLLSDELKTGTLSLSVFQTSSENWTVTASGGTAAERNPVTELFYETVAYKYISADPKMNLASIRWENFQMNESRGMPTYFDAMVGDADYQSTFTLTDPTGKGKDLLCTLRVDNSSSTPDNEHFTVYFGFPENGQIRLKVRASRLYDTETGETRFTWSSPSIVKEGSDN